jgi:hypothetical protein
MKQVLYFLFSFCILSVHAADDQRCFFLTGASFAVPENGWFEVACEAFDARPINRAVSGEAIMQAAVKMYNGTLYTAAELETIDAFIIMQVHNQAVAATQWLKDDYREYTSESIAQNYAVAYDYVIQKYRADCLQLKDNPASKYFGSEQGKPALIVLCTHWHDSRTVYNANIRTLADRWQLPLVKWDEQIGFTRTTPDPDGRQPSRKYAQDTETIGGTVYGWHPMRGRGQYIQLRMAEIFISEMEQIFGTIPVSATVHDKSGIITGDEEAWVSFSFTGTPPWNLTWSVNGVDRSLENITANPLFLPVDMPVDAPATVRPQQITNAAGAAGDVAGEVTIYRADRQAQPVFDTYVHQAFPSTTYLSDELFQIKRLSGNYSRESFISFRTEQLSANAVKSIFRAWFYERIYPNDALILEPHTVEIAGNTSTYTTMNWTTRPTVLTPLDTIVIRDTELNSYISFDITSWLNAQIAAGQPIVTLRLKIIGDTGSGLLNFYSSESSAPFRPQIMQHTASAMHTDERIFPAGIDATDHIAIYTFDGKLLCNDLRLPSGHPAIDMNNFPAGMYLIRIRSERLGGSRSFSVVKR